MIDLSNEELKELQDFIDLSIENEILFEHVNVGNSIRRKIEERLEHMKLSDSGVD